MAAELDILDKRMVEGDDVVVIWTLTLTDGTAYDFTGVTKLWFTLKKDTADDDTGALIGPLNSVSNPTQVKFGGVDPGAGKVFVWMKAAETKTLAQYKRVYYDLQVLKSSKVNTLVRGQMSFVHEVTRATT